LNLEPDCREALDIEARINERVQGEGLFGMALVSGAIGAAALFAGILAASFKRK
jgi:hypothetical protein